MKGKDKDLVELAIPDLFTQDVQYVIPIYQRNYAWGEIEREQLLEDIKDAQGEYFLGSLVVYERDDAVYEVIDGQQRLTTLFVLLTALKKFPPARTLTFEAREKSNRTLEKIVQGHPVVDDEFFNKELLAALSHFQQSKIVNEEMIEKLHQVKLLRIIVPKDTDLNHYFEIMNTRGEQLEAHEIVKARLMSRINGDEVEKKRFVFSKIWDACSNMGKYVQMSFNKPNRIALFGSNYEQMQFDDFKDILDKVRIPQDDGNDGKGIDRLSIAKAVELYSMDEASSGSDDEEEEDSRFESIITFPHFLLHVTKLLKNDGSDENDVALDDKKLLERIDDQIEPLDFALLMLKTRFLFDQHIIKREYYLDYREEGQWSLKRLKYYSSGKNSKNSINYVNAFSSGEENVQEKILALQSVFRITYTSPKTMHWMTHALSFLIKHEKTADFYPKYVSLLEGYARRKVEESNFNIEKGLAVERIVFTYLDYLLWRDGYSDIIKKMDEYDYTFRNSLEHFYPQHPDTKEGHEKLAEADLNHFGNLCLITSSANSKFSNQSPKAKLTNKNTIKSSQKLWIMATITEKDNWDKAAIRKHGQEMATILYQELLLEY